MEEDPSRDLLDDEDGGSSAQKDSLDRKEQLSRIIVNYFKIVLIVGFGILGIVLKMGLDEREERRQKAQIDAELSKPYFDEALRLLREETNPNKTETTDTRLLNWAVDVFAHYSPVDVEEPLKKDLRAGALKFSHLYEEQATHQWRLELSPSGRAGTTKIERGLQTISLDVPKELQGDRIEHLTLNLRASDAERDRIFAFLQVVEKKSSAEDGGIKIQYLLREGAEVSSDLKLLVSATFVVRAEPIFYRPKGGTPNADDRKFFTEKGESVYFYGSSDYYTYEDTSGISEQELREFEKKREQDRQNSFDKEWEDSKKED